MHGRVTRKIFVNIKSIITIDLITLLIMFSIFIILKDWCEVRPAFLTPPLFVFIVKKNTKSRESRERGELKLKR